MSVVESGPAGSVGARAARDASRPSVRFSYNVVHDVIHRTIVSMYTFIMCNTHGIDF